MKKALMSLLVVGFVASVSFAAELKMGVSQVTPGGSVVMAGVTDASNSAVNFTIVSGPGRIVGIKRPTPVNYGIIIQAQGLRAGTAGFVTLRGGGTAFTVNGSTQGVHAQINVPVVGK